MHLHSFTDTVIDMLVSGAKVIGYTDYNLKENILLLEQTWSIGKHLIFTRENREKYSPIKLKFLYVSV